MELVVVPIALSTFKLFCLSFRMCWAWSFQVGRALAPIVVVQFLNCPLEQIFLRSSGVFTVSVFRASAKLLQMSFLHSSWFLVLEWVALERKKTRSSGPFKNWATTMGAKALPT